MAISFRSLPYSDGIFFIQRPMHLASSTFLCAKRFTLIRKMFPEHTALTLNLAHLHNIPQRCTTDCHTMRFESDQMHTYWKREAERVHRVSTEILADGCM